MIKHKLIVYVFFLLLLSHIQCQFCFCLARIGNAMAFKCTKQHIHVADIITSFSFRWRSVRIISPCNEYPLNPTFYSKTEVCRGILFGPKHRLWSRLGEAVLKCTHDL